jgi:8-oxo-dGTP diphosphatase
VTQPNTWTGHTACALQAALRLSNDAFARKLGIAVRTVANWHENPDVTPRNAVQQLLDHAYASAPPATRTHFAALTADADAAPDPAPIHNFRVAIDIVTRGTEILLVQRREDSTDRLHWQFPAGMVKPERSLEAAIVRETHIETGIHCRIVRPLGRRLHPVTRVYCDYFLCEYLTGEAANLDPAENAAVTWAPIAALTRFIPADRIFPPILEALEIPNDAAG